MGENQKQTPDISDPHKLAAHHAWRDWPYLKKGWKGLLGFMFLSFWLGFGLAWWLVVASKDATINAKEATIELETKRADGLQAEHEKLFKENADLKLANAELTSPLKKRTLILSAQLKQFAEGCTNVAQEIEYHNAYNNRFTQRVYKAIAQLDEEGQTSAQLYDTAQRAAFEIVNKSNYVMIVSKELERLAIRLKD